VIIIPIPIPIPIAYCLLPVAYCLLPIACGPWTVLAQVLHAPVLALRPWCTWGLFRSLPALATAIPAVILGAASAAAPVCVLAGATSARKVFSLLRLHRGWLLKLLNERQLLYELLSPRGSPGGADAYLGEA
jgi:hypothetical protein